MKTRLLEWSDIKPGVLLRDISESYDYPWYFLVLSVHKDELGDEVVDVIEYFVDPFGKHNRIRLCFPLMLSFWELMER